MTRRARFIPLLIFVSTSLLLATHGSGRAQANQAVCTAPGEQNSPRVVGDGAGGAIVTWEDLDANAGIHAHHVLPSGIVDPAWPSNGTALCTAPNDQRRPAIVSDGAGGAIVAWEDIRDGIQFDVYAQHVLSNATVDSAWPVDGRALCTAAGDQGSAAIVSDGAGGAIVAWSDFRNGTDYSVFSQHVSSTGVVDPAWPVDGRALSPAGSAANPQVVSDGSSGAIVIWEDSHGANSATYAQHVLSTGALDPAWPVNGRNICDQTDQTGATMVADNSGGAIVAWSDFRSGTDYDMYAQHLLPSGSLDPAWPSTGRALCVQPGDQFYACIISDANGGAIVAWQDFRGGARYDIVAQHILSGGVVDPAWPLDGRDLSTSSRDQWRPTITSDGVGGAIVAWENLVQVNDADVYAQHVRSTGVVDPAWPQNGIAVSDAPDDQSLPCIVSDNAGGAISAWRDKRDGVNYHIYAQRIPASGVIVAVAPRKEPDRFLLGAPHPNPARGDGTTIRFDLPTAQRVSVSVYDVSGHLVRTLAEREFPAGSQNLLWDGTSEVGTSVSAGVYFVRVTAGSASAIGRVAILR